MTKSRGIYGPDSHVVPGGIATLEHFGEFANLNFPLDRTGE